MEHCKEYLELISAAIDGALSPDEQARLEEHLSSCPECRALYADLNRVHRALLDLPPMEVPAGLTDRILEAVAADNITALPKPKKSLPARWRSLVAAAALFLVLAGAWGMSHGLLNQPTKNALPEFAARGTADLSDPISENEEDFATYSVQGAMTESAEIPASFKVAGAPPIEQNTAPADQPDEMASDTQDTQDTETMAVDAISPTVEEVTDPEITVSVTGAFFVVPNNVEAPESVSNTLPAQGNPDGQDEEPEEALSLLVEFLWSETMPDGMQRVDTEEFLGYATPLVSQDGDPYSQQVSIRLEYLGLTPNGKYHEFWLHSFLLDDPETGLAHSSTLNFFAVPLDGGEILVQRQEIDLPDGTDKTDDIDEIMELYLAGIEAYHEAISN